MDTKVTGDEAITHRLIALENAIQRLSASLIDVAQGDRPPAASEILAAHLLEILGVDPAASDARCIEKVDAANRMLALASSVVQRAHFLQSSPSLGVTDEANEKKKIEQWREFPEPADGTLRSVLAGRFADWRNANSHAREHAVPRAQEQQSSTAQIKRRLSAIQHDVEAAEAAHADGQLAALTRVMAKIDQSLKSGPANVALTHRIESLRREQLRLRDWQRWDDGQRRKQLVAEAQELARITAEKVPVNTHAAAIDQLRKRWKDLDKLGGTTNKALWLSFDSALTAAYAPVSAHQEKLKVARQENLNARNRIVDALVRAAARLFPAESQAVTSAQDAKPDWRAVARALEEARIAWRKLGPVEHTVPRKAQQGDRGVAIRYEEAAQTLERPLKEAYREAMLQRERLISAAKNFGISAHGAARDLVDKVRDLQTQWQAHASMLPLPRRDERALWTDFKAAIDAVFAERDAARTAQETETNAQIKVRETIIERLTTFSSVDDAPQIKHAIAEADTAWRATTEIAKPKGTQLDARYRAAREVAIKQLGKLAQHASQARFDALLAKMALCRERESAGEQSTDLEARWNANSNLPSAWNNKLDARFRGLIHAQPSSASISPPGAAPSEGLANILLNLEVACGIESPDEYLAARHQLKLRALKDAMEGRRTTAATSADIEQRLLDAAATPYPDEGSRQRLVKIIEALRRHQEE